MKELAASLRTIHSAVDLSDKVEGLKLYSAACVIGGQLEQQIEASESSRKDHAIEKIGLFLSYLQYAVIPSDGSHKSPSDWLAEAGENLYKVEIDLGAA